jgi:hypothetical protein
VMPPGWPAHEEPAPGLPYGAGGRNSFLATETALRDRKRKLMPNGLNRESAIRLEGCSQRGPGGPQESGPAAGCQGTIQAGPRPQPRAGPGLPVVPPDLAVRGPSAVTHPAGTRSRGARCQPRAVLPSRGQAQGHPGPAGLAGPPLARWPQQGQPAAAGTPGHFPSHRNAATPGPCSAISRLEKAASEKGASPQSRLANMRRVMTGNPFCRGPARPANGGKGFARRRARWPTPAGRPGAAGPARLRRRRAGIRDNKQPRQTHDLQTGGAGCQHVGHEARGRLLADAKKLAIAHRRGI